MSLYPVALHGLVFLSNHYHMLLSVPDAQRLAAFMNYFNGNLAREAGRLANWREKFWSRRYQAIAVSDEPAAQIARLEYILAHGVKEGLVSHPVLWPGVHCVEPLLSGKALEGVWIDRTTAFRARTAGETMKKEDLELRLEVRLSPLPCWAHLDDDTYRSRVAELMNAIAQESSEQDNQAVLPASHHEKPLRS